MATFDIPLLHTAPSPGPGRRAPPLLRPPEEQGLCSSESLAAPLAPQAAPERPRADVAKRLPMSTPERIGTTRDRCLLRGRLRRQVSKLEKGTRNGWQGPQSRLPGGAHPLNVCSPVPGKTSACSLLPHCPPALFCPRERRLHELGYICVCTAVLRPRATLFWAVLGTARPSSASLPRRLN